MATHHPLIPSWVVAPIPNLSLSTSGVLALADLSTIAQRTAITGGSSWLDAFVLAPGLHYQQAADALDQNSATALSAELGLTSATENVKGELRRYVINNVGMVKYLRRMWVKEGKVGVVKLHVKLDSEDHKFAANSFRKRMAGTTGYHHPHKYQPRTTPTKPGKPRHRMEVVSAMLELDWLSNLFYLLSPLLTVVAIVFMVLLDDWWGLGFISALMISRILNIWAIKRRSKPVPPSQRMSILPPAAGSALPLSSMSQFSLPPPPPPRREDSRLTEYTIDLGVNKRVILQGLEADLQAVTTDAWMRAKDILENYLEAAAKLIVYLMAAFSGNLTQAGAITLMALLLTSAALLGLSNSHAKSLQMHGRRVGKLKVDGVHIESMDPRMAAPAVDFGGISHGVPMHIVPEVDN